MPECFQHGSEQALASYVEGLCSPQRAELRGRIHAVEVKHDRIRASLPPPGAKSVGESLRAVTMDPTPSSSYDGQSLIPPARLPGVYRSNLRRAAPLALGLPAAFLACLWLFRAQGSQQANDPSPALAHEAAMLPEISVRSLPVAAAATPTATAIAEPTKVVAPVPEPSLAKAGEIPESAPLPITSIASLPVAPRAPQVRRVAPRRAESAPASAAPESSIPTPASASEPPRKANSWDPSTFGGRY